MNGLVRMLRGPVVLAACLTHSASACACSIPVFRYALERWPADAFRVEVVHAEPLVADDRAALVRLEDGAAFNGGAGNYVVERSRVGTGAAVVTVRAPRGPEPLWQGSLAEAVPVMQPGRVQRELVRRLLDGDAVVWLVLPGRDDAAAGTVAVLDRELPLVAADTALPRGIGLPGSELLADVPLEVRFSVLVVGPQDGDAGLLRRTLSARLPQDAGAGADAATLVAPVFGRGRVARVMRAADLDADAVADVTAFLCGACSCQAKQLAPGFDLLLEAAWDERLFGGEPPPPSAPAPVDAAPVYVPIPGGAARGHTP